MKKNKDASRILEIAGVRRPIRERETSYEESRKDVLGAITNAEGYVEEFETALGYIEETLYQLDMEVDKSDKQILHTLDKHIQGMYQLLSQLEKDVKHRKPSVPISKSV